LVQTEVYLNLTNKLAINFSVLSLLGLLVSVRASIDRPLSVRPKYTVSENQVFAWRILEAGNFNSANIPRNVNRCTLGRNKMQ